MFSFESQITSPGYIQECRPNPAQGREISASKNIQLATPYLQKLAPIVMLIGDENKQILEYIDSYSRQHTPVPHYLHQGTLDSSRSTQIKNINSPLWTYSQYLESKIRSVTEKIAHQETNFLLRAKKIFDELVISGKIRIEDGKAHCLYQGNKYEFPIPHEWRIDKPHSVAETKQESSPKELKWEEIIQEAIDRSPGALLDELPDSERAEVLRKEWLVKDPLTGICTGLAIEFLLDIESKANAQTMLPSSGARYWEKLLIPMMEEVMKLHYCENSEQLNEERHYSAVYKHMIKIVEEKAHLKASIKASHVPLSQLGEKLLSYPGHSLVSIELPGTPVAANHTIYFNASMRTIADNGVIIKVPVEDDYAAFVDFYMQKMEYPDSADRFTLISVAKDPQFSAVRRPSFRDRVSLSAQITLNFLVRRITVPNAPLADYDITPLFAYPNY